MAGTEGGNRFEISRVTLIAAAIGGLFGSLGVAPCLIPSQSPVSGVLLFYGVGFLVGACLAVAGFEYFQQNPVEEMIEQVPVSGGSVGSIGSTLVGGMVGLLAVRYLLLDSAQEMGWRLFWEGLAEGRIMDLGVVLESSTFWLCVMGSVIGAGVANYAFRKATAESDPPPS